MSRLLLSSSRPFLSAINPDKLPSGPPPPPPPDTPVSLEISPSTLTIETPNTAQLTSVFKDINDVVVSGTVDHYSSSAPSKATVDNSGLITAVAAGNSNIIAHSIDPVIDSNICAVTVIAPIPPDTTPTSLTIAPTSVSFNIPGTAQLTPTFKNASSVVVAGTVSSYSSSNNTVASVDGSGLITAHHNGTCTITAHSTSPVLTSNDVDVNVIDNTPTQVILSESSITMNPGDQRQLFSTVKNAEDDTLFLPGTVQYFSDNTLVANVGQNSGLVTANDSAGTADITGQIVSPHVVSAPFIVTNRGIIAQPPPDGYPHLPLGFTLLARVLSGDLLPDTVINDSIEWTQSGGITKVTDGTSPIDSTSVLQEFYPPGSGNGSSSGFTYCESTSNHQNFPSKPVQLYISFFYKYSANFPTSLSANKIIYGQMRNDVGPDVVGNKFGYLANGSADYPFSGAVDASPIIFSPSGGTPYNTPITPFNAMANGVSVDGVLTNSIDLNQNAITNDPTQWKYSARNTWHRHELYMSANTPGQQNGTIKTWMDGVQIMDYTNRLKWSNNATQDYWGEVYWDAVYNNAVPMDAVNAYHRIKNLAVFGKSTF